MQEIHNKVALRGIKSLDDLELLTLILESRAQATTLMEEYGTLANIANTTTARLRMTAGLGVKLSERIQAAVELGCRVSEANRAIDEVISSSDDVVNIMRPLLKELKHEECWVLYLTNSNRIIERSRVSQGGIQATVVDHRLIVKRALELLSTRIIVLHNHPSGSATPSKADYELTKKVKEATSLFDIQLLDHIIISANDSFSFKSKGEL